MISGRPTELPENLTPAARLLWLALAELIEIDADVCPDGSVLCEQIVAQLSDGASYSPRDVLDRACMLDIERELERPYHGMVDARGRYDSSIGEWRPL